MFCYLAATGSLLVSYVRGRAQSLGFDVKVGFFTRLERYLVLVPVLFTRWGGEALSRRGAAERL